MSKTEKCDAEREFEEYEQEYIRMNTLPDNWAEKYANDPNVVMCGMITNDDSDEDITEKRECQLCESGEAVIGGDLVTDVHSGEDESFEEPQETHGEEEDPVPDEIYDKLDGITLDPDQELDILNLHLKDGTPGECIADLDSQYNEGDHIFLHTFDQAVADGPEKDYMMKQMINEEFSIDTPSQALIFVLNLKEHIRRLIDGEHDTEEQNTPGEPQITDVSDTVNSEVQQTVGDANIVESKHQRHLDTLERFHVLLDSKKPKISTEMLLDILPLNAAYPEYSHGFKAFVKYALFSIQQRAHKRDLPALHELLVALKSIRSDLDQCVGQMEKNITTEGNSDGHC